LEAASECEGQTYISVTVTSRHGYTDVNSPPDWSGFSSIRVSNKFEKDHPIFRLLQGEGINPLPGYAPKIGGVFFGELDKSYH
jgi:hypothetical protein